MPDLLLHIGYHKTGTTWLQNHVFPDASLGLCAPFHAKQAVFDFVLPPPGHFDAAAARAHYDAAMQHVMPGLCPVLSMERLVGSPHFGHRDSFLIAQRLVDTFPKARVLIVVREQAAALLSTYRQYVKHNGGLPLDRYLFPKLEATYVPTYGAESFVYSMLVAHYDRLFGQPNVLVLPYEALRTDPQAFLRRVTTFAGVAPSDEALRRAAAAPRANPSLSALGTAVKRRTNRIVSVQSSLNPSPAVRSERGKWLSKWVAYEAERLWPRALNRRLDRQQRAYVEAAVGRMFAHDNAALARRMQTDLGALGYHATPLPEHPLSPDAPLTFHIIYTPGTAAHLGRFVGTLLRHAPTFHFRLVANGCPADERAALRALADTSERLSTCSAPGDDVWAHGALLDWLFARDEGTHFAFMDSDMFATDDFERPVRAVLARGGAFFSGVQPWTTPAERIASHGSVLAGRHTHAVGRPAGSTFFAVYPREAVACVRADYGVGFSKYRPADLPQAAHRRLHPPHLHFAKYDTAKALNLLLRADGLPFDYLPLPMLVHLGGFSRQTAPDTPPPSALRAAWLNRRRRVVQRLRKRFGKTRPRAYHARRAVAQAYFAEALEALQDDRPLPPPPPFDAPAVQNEIAQIAAALRLAFGHHADPEPPCPSPTT